MPDPGTTTAAPDDPSPDPPPDAPAVARPAEAATGEYRPDATTSTFTPADPAATDPLALGGHPPRRPVAARGEGIGTVVAGRYTLIRVIGEGGMGSVYLAGQTEPVKRQVALKLIKAGMDSKAVLSRFDAERQALALMDHPNIARIYDGGVTPAGHPFFVMELVRGEPLTAYCDRHRLPVRARLELFVQVCRAVQHAHQKGVIHRDLKPGNVLVTEVDGRPTPKVIDFGVAKATEQKLTDLSFSDVGAIVGTPAYMSPEQADPGCTDIDTRTDVYALGVILYELLVGSPPIDARQFKRGAVLEMLRMVREVEPPRPSTRVSTAAAGPSMAANRNTEPAALAKLLRGELDWVVMKALEKERSRRYETADGLARDLQRYLADEVVEARPPSRGYRLRKVVRRHRGLVTAAALVAAALVAGITGTTLGLFEAKRQKGLAEHGWARAEAEQTRAEAQQTRAEQNFATARALILDMGTQINQIETGQADPRLADLARKRALDKAREHFDQFRSGRPDDVGVQSQAAALHRYAANVSRLLNDFPAAEAAYAATVQILTDLAARHPDQARFRDELAMTLSDRAMLEKRMGKLRVSSATLDQAVQLAQGPQGTRAGASARRTRATIDLDRASTAIALGQFEDAAQYAAQARELFDQWNTAPAGERQTIDPLLAAMAASRLAVARRELGRTVEALATHDDAVAQVRALAGPKASRDVRYWECETRRERARTAAAAPDRRTSAAEDLVDVIRGLEKLMTEYQSVGFYREAVAAAYLDRGHLLLLLGRPAEATTELTKSLAVSRELLDKFGVLSASMLVRGQTFLTLGRAQAAAGKADEAAGHWKNAATVFRLALKIDAENVHHRRGLAEAERELATPAK